VICDSSFLNIDQGLHRPDLFLCGLLVGADVFELLLIVDFKGAFLGVKFLLELKELFLHVLFSE